MRRCRTRPTVIAGCVFAVAAVIGTLGLVVSYALEPPTDHMCRD